MCTGEGGAARAEAEETEEAEAAPEAEAEEAEAAEMMLPRGVISLPTQSRVGAATIGAGSSHA